MTDDARQAPSGGHGSLSAGARSRVALSLLSCLRWSPIVLILLLAWPPAGWSALEGTVVGKVSQLKGLAFVVRNGVRYLLALDMDVLDGDVISTGDGGRIEMRLKDDTILTLGDKTTFAINDYDFQGDSGVAKFRLHTGAFKIVSGIIARVNRNAFFVRTPVATIGIRGTEFWAGTLEGKFNVVLLGGTGIYVENASGRVDITEVGHGTTIEAPGIPVTGDDYLEEMRQVYGLRPPPMDPPSTPIPFPPGLLAKVAESVSFR